MNTSSNILLCGVGGQGIVLASKLIAQAAMAKGIKARTAETIGMAQRGGCVVSHVRTGNEVFSPLVPYGCADFIIAFEPAEAVRNLPFLKKGGTVITAQKPVMPVTASLSGGYDAATMLDFLRQNVPNLYLFDTEAMTEQLGTVKALNVLMLGAACCAQGFPVSTQEVEQTIINRVAPKFHELNKQALYLGSKALEK